MVHKSVLPMRTAKIGYIIMSLICCLFGIGLIVFNKISISVIGFLVGIIMMLFGVVKLIGYFSKDLFRLAFQYDLAFGILLIVVGILLMLKPSSLMNFSCIVIGVCILCDGLFKIQISFDSKAFGIKLWWLILLFATATAVVGLMIIFKPEISSRMLMILLGASLLTDGILSLSTVLTSVKIIKHQIPDVIEIENYEERSE